MTVIDLVSYSNVRPLPLRPFIKTNIDTTTTPKYMTDLDQRLKLMYYD